MAFRYWIVSLRNLQILPVSNNNDSLSNVDQVYDFHGQATSLRAKINDDNNFEWYLKYTDELYVEIDTDGYKDFFTEVQSFPWEWSGQVCRFIYNTFFHQSLKHKYIRITLWKRNANCVLPYWMNFNDIKLASNIIDIYSIATGSENLEIPLLHDLYKSTLCIVKLQFTMVEECRNLLIQFKNMDVSDIYSHLLPFFQQNPSQFVHTPDHSFSVNLSFFYGDHVKSHWQLQHYVLNESSIRNDFQDNNHNACIVIREMRLSLPGPMLASDFIYGCLQVIIWNTLLRDQQHNKKKKYIEYGRVVIPILGTYKSDHLGWRTDISKKVFWHNDFSNYKEHEEEEPCAKISGRLIFQNTPLFIQLRESSHHMYLIQGLYYPGFPFPTGNNIIDVDLKSIHVPHFIKDYVLQYHYFIAQGYADFPPSFLFEETHDILQHHSYTQDEQNVNFQEINMLLLPSHTLYHQHQQMVSTLYKDHNEQIRLSRLKNKDKKNTEIYLRQKMITLLHQPCAQTKQEHVRSYLDFKLLFLWNR